MARLRYTARCATGGCADVTSTNTGVTMISTLGADRGRLALDHAEFVQFIEDVKAGHLDGLYAVARDALNVVTA